MPTIRINKGCLVISQNSEIHILKKESILGYTVSGNYLKIHTSIRGINGYKTGTISLEYDNRNQTSVKECEKHVDILTSVLSSEVEAPADLLGL